MRHSRLQRRSFTKRRSIKHRARTIGVCCLAWHLVTVAAAAEPAAALALGTQRRLTWDESLFSRCDGIQFQMAEPHRAGDICLKADRPWESWQIGGMLSVLHEGDRFRMWYGVTHGVRNGEEYAIAYAESADGIHWTKPELGLVEYEGSTRNNLVVAYSSVIGQVFVDPNAADEDRYKMLAAIYPLRDGDPKRYLTVLSSPDGLRWSKPERNVVPSGQIALDTQSQAFWDRDLGKYLLYTRMAGRQVARSESADLLRFPDPVLVIRPDDPVTADYYQSNVTKYDEAANAYFALVPVFYHPGDASGNPVGRDRALVVNYRGNPITVVAPDTIDVHLFTSNDSVAWQRRGDGRPFIGLGTDGAFDSRQIYTGVGYARVADEIWIYYSGFDVTHCGCLEGDDPFQQYLGGIGRVTLRVDGFIAATAGPAGAEVVTHPVTFSGDCLELNVDCGATGHVDVELQSVDGVPIPGFSLEDSDRVYHNNVGKRVAWQGRTDLASLAGKPVRLRLALRNARLYSFQFPLQSAR
jgi:hypothetical protein